MVGQVLGKAGEGVPQFFCTAPYRIQQGCSQGGLPGGGTDMGEPHGGCVGQNQECPLSTAEGTRVRVLLLQGRSGCCKDYRVGGKVLGAPGPAGPRAAWVGAPPAGPAVRRRHWGPAEERGAGSRPLCCTADAGAGCAHRRLGPPLSRSLHGRSSKGSHAIPSPLPGVRPPSPAVLHAPDRGGLPGPALAAAPTCSIARSVCRHPSLQ